MALYFILLLHETSVLPSFHFLARLNRHIYIFCNGHLQGSQQVARENFNYQRYLPWSYFGCCSVQCEKATLVVVFYSVHSPESVEKGQKTTKEIKSEQTQEADDFSIIAPN